MSHASERARRDTPVADAPCDDYTPSSANSSTSPCGVCGASRFDHASQHYAAHLPPEVRVAPLAGCAVCDATETPPPRSVACILEALALDGVDDASRDREPVTIGHLRAIARRLRDGDAAGRLPRETGHAPPVVDPFFMPPL